jgi:hypothetical protein
MIYSSSLWPSLVVFLLVGCANSSAVPSQTEPITEPAELRVSVSRDDRKYQPGERATCEITVKQPAEISASDAFLVMLLQQGKVNSGTWVAKPDKDSGPEKWLAEIKFPERPGKYQIIRELHYVSFRQQRLPCRNPCRRGLPR